MLATLSIAAAAVVPAGLAVNSLVSPATAGAATTSHRATACKVTNLWTTPPTGPRTYAASTAGKVTVAPIKPAGNIRVVSVSAARGWSYFVDTASGNSVDVYFRSGVHRVKFEAGIEGPTQMLVTVTVC
jgi:hypothetical protein